MMGLEDHDERSKAKESFISEEIEAEAEAKVSKTIECETSQLEVKAEEDVKRREEKRTDGLPRELCVEVFSRLPLQDFVRSRCIAKWVKTELLQPNVWKSRSLLMVEAFSVDEETNGLFGVPQLSNEGGWFMLPPPSNAQLLLDFIGSSRGLLCVLIYKQDSIKDSIQDSTRFSIYNPISSETVILPRLTLDEPVIMYGFGESRGEGRDLKLAVFTKSDQAVLTLGTAQWRLSKRSVEDGQENHAIAKDRPQDGVCIEGNLFWLRSSGIVKFCLHEEIIKEVDTPSWTVGIGSWVNKLAVCVRDYLNSWIYSLESNAEWNPRTALQIECCINSRLRIIGLPDKLVVVHKGRLGFVEHGRTNVTWYPAEGDRLISAAVVMEPTFNRLVEAEHDDHKDIEKDDEGNDEYLNEDSEDEGTVDKKVLMSI